MPAKLIDGKAIAKKIREDVKAEVSKLDSQPGLGVILVGDDEASHLYVSLKEKACEQVGIRFTKAILPSEATEAEVMTKIDEFNSSKDINGFIIQLPLPPHLDENKMIDAMLPTKDADGFHPKNLSRLLESQPRVYPVLANAVMHLLDSTEEQLEDKQALIISNNRILYEPIEKLLKDRKIESIWCNRHDIKLNPKIRNADIVIVAIGQANFIDGDLLKDGAIAIDIGTNRVDDNLVGDISFEEAEKKVSWITPVPGGVGPVTVALLLKNVVELAKQQ